MKNILVWLSGWVDSAVAAYLLQQQGFSVTAWFMINYTTDDETCTTKEDLAEAQKVADHLGIKLHVFDYQEEYHNRIVKYIVESYKAGLTPNPDVLCNSEIKFNVFLDEGIALGFDAIATWHYAQIQKEISPWEYIPYDHPDYFAEAAGSYALFKWIDSQKDQSYFLAWLSQRQLAKAIFPLWWLEKSEVRQIAQKAWLPNAARKDSQWICFIGKVPMREFLQQYIPVQKWPIVDATWKILWEHNGIRWYTVWQRQGLWIAAPQPLFVIKKEIATNTLIVWYADNEELYSDHIDIWQWHWIGETTNLPRTWHAKIRYRQADQEVALTKNGEWLTASFWQPQRAVASGQILAAYEWNKLIWSWIIL